MKRLLAIATLGAVAMGAPRASAQTNSHTLSYDSISTMQRMPAELGRLNVEMKVSQDVAMTAKISADSALALAVAQVPEGVKVNSAKMTIKGGHLVYDIAAVPSGKNTVNKIYVDAIAGSVIQNKQLGGLNGVVKKRQAHTKEVNARKAAETDTSRTP